MKTIIFLFLTMALAVQGLPKKATSPNRNALEDAMRELPR